MSESKDKSAFTNRGRSGYENNLESNWNGNIKFEGTAAVPESIEHLCNIVANASPPIRVVGRGHSFTPLAECSGGTLLSLSSLNRILDFCPPKKAKLGSITVEGGTTYTEIAQFLGDRGALRNLPSCPQFTVAGAIATATHGSGVNIPNLSADVSMLEFVKADGTIVRYSRSDDDGILQGCRVHLGCLGVVSCLMLDVMPYFEVESFRYDDIPLEDALRQLPELWNRCDSLSVWTSGFGRGHGTGLCWMTFRHFVTSSEPKSSHTPPSKTLLGDIGKLCDRQIPRYCSDLENPGSFSPSGRGPWYDALTLTFDRGQETSMTTTDIQAEFFVPLEYSQDALHAVWRATRDWTFSSPWGYSGEFPTKGLVDAMEFRQVKGGDGAWLSPHPVDSLAIHISFNGDSAYRAQIQGELVPVLETALKPFHARAHWGKLASGIFAPDCIEKFYGEGLESFRNLCDKHDPLGKFRNDHVKHMLFGHGVASNQ